MHAALIHRPGAWLTLLRARSFIFRVLANFTVGSARIRRASCLLACVAYAFPRSFTLTVVSAVFTFVFALPALIWGFQPSLVRPQPPVCSSQCRRPED